MEKNDFPKKTLEDDLSDPQLLENMDLTSLPPGSGVIVETKDEEFILETTEKKDWYKIRSKPQPHKTKNGLRFPHFADIILLHSKHFEDGKQKESLQGRVIVGTHMYGVCEDFSYILTSPITKIAPFYTKQENVCQVDFSRKR